MNDDVAKAILLLKQALPEMNRRNIATTPENYAVWYEYVSRGNMDLVAAIDALERDHTPLTSEVHHQLYLKYIASSREAAINKISETVRAVINEYLRSLANEGQNLSDYAQSLEAFANRLAQTEENQNGDALLRDMLSEVLSLTRKREETSVLMQSSLTQMVAEMRELREQIARLNAEATTDPLTRVSNRQCFDQELEKQTSLAIRDQSPLSLLMLDIDHFRKFNDRFGHLIGDKVLRFFATLLKNNIKGHDCVARFGGEEFAVILPDTDYEGALSVAENIRSRLARQTLSDSAEKIQLGTITVSIGVATLQPDDSAELVLRRADRCLREAKSHGRNLVLGERDLHFDPSEDTNTML